MNPELYDLSQDPSESYDVAEQHADIVRDMQARIEKLMPGFPADIFKAWNDQKVRSAARTPAGAIPRPAPPVAYTSLKWGCHIRKLQF